MTKRFNTVREVGDLLGISRTAAYELVRNGTLPSVRIGGAGIRVNSNP
jgi:excisionase family DNA binding protein